MSTASQVYVDILADAREPPTSIVHNLSRIYGENTDMDQC